MHVEGCAGDLSLLQRVEERLFVDDAAARGVDQERRRLHAGKEGGVDHPLRRRAVGYVDADEIGLPRQRVEREIDGVAKLGFLFYGQAIALVVDDLHAQRSGAFGDLARHLAHADQAEGLGGQHAEAAHPGPVEFGPRRPGLKAGWQLRLPHGLDRVVSVNEVARQTQQQRHDVFGRR